MRRIAPLLLLFAACTTTTPTASAPPPATVPPVAAQAGPCNPGHTILNATLYVQSAAEYQAAATQTFHAARTAIDEALADPARIGALEETSDAPSQPPAIITDLDETVLDNTPFEARVIRAGLTYDGKMWKEWTAEGVAGAIPGAAAFLSYAKSRGVTVFYISNRDEDERPGTRRNLEQLGFPLDAGVETLLLRSGSSDKSARRAEVAAAYRVLLLAGDDLNDFANMREKTWQERKDLVTRMEDWWGTRWFMLPNPMYGSWENAAIGTGGTPCERVDRKVGVLK
jgi:acid phosphatase